MSASPISFAHGVASGDPYVNSVILWTRITPPEGTAGRIDVSWQISRSAGFEAGAIVDSGSFGTGADRDWTVKVEADRLSADTPYYYRFLAGDAVSMLGQTKTLPVGSDPVRLAVFSCTNFPAAETFAAYGRAAAINAANPYDAWLHLGDYIYEYGPGGYGEAEDSAGSRGFQPNREIVSLDDYRLRYGQYHTDANLQALRAAAPLIGIWDDHETANDSWAGGAQNHQSASEGDWLARRDAALKAYYEWIPIREPGLRQASDGASALSPLTQGYRSFSFGDVLALHVLETRLTARDEQLKYPDAAAVQVRIGSILANPAELLAYAAKLGLTPPSGPEAIQAFASALAPLVTQELVIATVQQAWGDPSRDLIGADQLAWLQQRMATSSASWQVLGQQVLMQSMAVPVQLLLNAGDPGLLDQYAAPLQKLATGTSFANLTPAEQALFAEATKVPYNLDAWDGYGVDREKILQSALALGKRVISLAGDTHNAWAGVLDTMSAAAKPAGTVVGAEFATPGVTSPGFEKYLPGADAYIRAKYPAVDGLDGLFEGYTNGLKYADLNRRGFLDLTITPDQAIGSYQLLDGSDPLTAAPRWVSETVSASSSLAFSRSGEASPLITWQPTWRELDLVFGVAVDAAGQLIDLDPGAYATVPRDGVELPDVSVKGSDGSDRIFVASGSTVEAGAGGDELFNSDSLGGNRLVGGAGGDRFFLRAAGDAVIGGNLLAGATGLGLPAIVASADSEPDIFLLDTSDPGDGVLQILDFNPGVDQILLDGQAPQGSWPQIRQQLLASGLAINAVPSFTTTPITLNLVPGQEVLLDLGASVSDPDADRLDLVLLEAPAWISLTGMQLRATLPAGLTQAQLATIPVVLGLSDGKAVALQDIQLMILPPAPPLSAPTLALASDTGSSPSDGITANPTVQVAGLQDGATWEFSINGGNSWSSGTGSSFVLLSGTYPAGSILARQINSSGNTSGNGQLGPITIDTTPPAAPALTLPNGSITASGDWITYVAAGKPVVVGAQFLETGAAYTYSEDNGKTWTSFENSSFNLAWVDPSKRWSLKARQLDRAGNQGAESDPLSFSLFQVADTIPQPNVASYAVQPLGSDAIEAIKKNSTPNAKIQAFALDYRFDHDPARAQSSLLLDADLLPFTTVGSGTAGFGFWGLDPASGKITESLTYDPGRRGGATPYDINGDTIVDFIDLRLGVTSLGDSDPSNAKIVGAITATREVIDPRLSPNGGQEIQVVDPARSNSKAAVYMSTSMKERARTVNEIGFVVVDAGEPMTLDLIRQRGGVLFSGLESINTPDLTGVNLRSKISLRDGQTLRFYESVDNTFAALSSGKTNLSELGGSFRFLDYTLDSDRLTAQVSSPTGLSFTLGFAQPTPGLSDLIASRQLDAPVLDFSSSAVASRPVSVDWSLTREAFLSPVFSLYRVINLEGTVRDSLTGALFNPGDAGYKAASIRSQVDGLSGLTVGNLQSTGGRATVTENALLAPMALVKTATAEDMFYVFAAANPDGLSHFRRLGDNVFGLEDLKGGGDLDFDDHIFAIRSVSLA
jgi:phosphodiesterase/alkaline phosphatase D-like protein